MVTTPSLHDREAPQGAPLENNANKCTPPPPRIGGADVETRRSEGLREQRYELLRLLWDVSQLRRLRGCRRGRRAEVVGVRWTEGQGAGFSGLVTCGSVWSCPVCSARILARRSLEIGAGLLSWERQGGRLVMGTLTMRHHRGHSLVQEWDALQESWHGMIRSRVWKKWLRRMGSPGLVRVVEVTYGDNGWHVHLHFVLLVAEDVDTGLVGEFTGWLFPKWHRALSAAGMPGALARGQDAHLVESVEAAVAVGEYLAKSTAYGAAESLGRELMGTWSKAARGEHGTEPAWRIAERFGWTGEVDLLSLWGEYERGSKGRRQATWTHGLRALLALGEEATDEQIAAEVVGDEDLVQITADGWTAALASGEPLCRILQAVEDGGTERLRDYLDRLGIAYRVPAPVVAP